MTYACENITFPQIRWRSVKISNPRSMSGSVKGILRGPKNGYALWIIQVVRSNNEHESSIGCSDGIRYGDSNRMRPDRIVRPVLCGKQNEINVDTGRERLIRTRLIQSST